MTDARVDEAILVVDDNPINRKLLRATLEAEGYTTCEACDGIEALAVLKDRPVAAVISDILMPRMDGLRLCAEVRKGEKFRSLPFVIYTCTYSGPGDESLGARVGADAYLRKPAPASAIIAALRDACAKVRSRPAAVIADESAVMKEYSEALIHKLEERQSELGRIAAQQECLARLSQAALEECGRRRTDPRCGPARREHPERGVLRLLGDPARGARLACA